MQPLRSDTQETNTNHTNPLTAPVLMVKENKNANPEGMKKTKRSSKGGLKTYIAKIGKSEVGKDISFASSGVEIVNGIALDVLDRLSTTAVQWAKYERCKTLSAKHYMAAVHTLIGGPFGDKMIADGKKAVVAYIASEEAAKKAVKA